jgi:hypothetical protein
MQPSVRILFVSMARPEKAKSGFAQAFTCHRPPVHPKAGMFYILNIFYYMRIIFVTIHAKV